MSAVPPELKEQLRNKIVDRSVLGPFDEPLFKGRPCWLWTGAKAKNGYGSLAIRRKTYHAHRVAYEVFRGEIPSDKQLDHLCRRRHCVNPWHLEVVTHAENGRRGSRAKLNHAAAAEIRASREPLRVLAERFGVSVKTVEAVRGGRAWAP